MSKKRKKSNNNQNKSGGRRQEPARMKDMVNVLDVLPVDVFHVARYTFDAWQKCYPDSTRTEYEERQRPDNILEGLGLLFAEWPEKKLDQYADLVVKPVLLDNDYFDWLGDRENTQENRLQYISTVDNTNDEARVQKLMDAGLLYSYWPYVVNTAGVLTNRYMDGRLEPETAKALTEYVNALIHNDHFSVYTIPYLLKWDQAFCEEDRFFSMAKDYFAGNAPKPQVRYQDLKFKAGINFFQLSVPFVVRECHSSGCFTIGEIRDYIQGYYDEKSDQTMTNARNLETMFLDGREESDDNIPNSKAGKLLQKELEQKSGNFGKQDSVFVYPSFSYSFHLDEWYNSFCEEFSQAGKLTLM